MNRLTGINDGLTRVESSAWELLRLLGESGPEADAGAASTQLSQIDQTLKTMQGWIADYEPQLLQVRQRTEALQSRTLPWITPAAVLITLVCLWIALSQVSVLAHAWSWWQDSGHNTP
jgi:hypothetical protein